MSIGVVALTASRFGWRRTKVEDEAVLPAATDDPADEAALPPATDDPADAAQSTQVRRFAPAVRWDASPEEYAAARASGDPPVP